MSKFRGVKTNNARTSAKYEIRRSVFDAIEGDRRVLDVYCGSGEMYRDIWCGADDYLGIDKVKQFDGRHTICGDALRAVHKEDLTRFNIFDIDAYGSPYDVLAMILPKVGRKHKRIGFALTDGTAMDLKLGRISRGLRQLTGIDCHVAKRAHVLQEWLINCVMEKTALSLRGSLSNVKIATGNKGSQMKYYSFIVTRDADRL